MSSVEPQLITQRLDRLSASWLHVVEGAGLIRWVPLLLAVFHARDIGPTSLIESMCALRVYAPQWCLQWDQECFLHSRAYHCLLCRLELLEKKGQMQVFVMAASLQKCAYSWVAVLQLCSATLTFGGFLLSTPLDYSFNGVLKVFSSSFHCRHTLLLSPTHVFFFLHHMPVVWSTPSYLPSSADCMVACSPLHAALFA